MRGNHQREHLWPIPWGRREMEARKRSRSFRSGPLNTQYQGLGKALEGIKVSLKGSFSPAFKALFSLEPGKAGSASPVGTKDQTQLHPPSSSLPVIPASPHQCQSGPPASFLHSSVGGEAHKTIHTFVHSHQKRLKWLSKSSSEGLQSQDALTEAGVSPALCFLHHHHHLHSQQHEHPSIPVSAPEPAGCSRFYRYAANLLFPLCPILPH